MPHLFPIENQHHHFLDDTTSAPMIDAREFKDSMAHIAFSIAIVCARAGQEELGRTVTSFMPLSADPPRLTVSIDAHSRLVDLINSSKSFSVSFLASGQEHVADAFAGKWGKIDRFSLAQWKRWPSGSRRLLGAAVSFDCELAAAISVGDHVLFVGNLIEALIENTTKPLLWSNRSYL